MSRQSSDSINQNLAWALFGTALIFNLFLPVYLPQRSGPCWISSPGIFGYTAYRQR